MPKYNKTPDDEIIKKEQQTNTGITVASGDITHSDWDSKDWRELQKDYIEMINGCPVISTTWNLIEYPLLQSEMKILSGKSNSEKAKEAVDYLYWCFDNLYKKPSYLKKHKIRAFYQGVSFHEIIEKRGDKYEFVKNGIKQSKITNRIIKLSPIQNDTISKFYYDEQNNFSGIEHEKRSVVKTDKDNFNLGSDVKYINIEAKKLSWVTFDESFDDVRGKSILRPVRRYYELANKIMDAKGLAIQRGAGIIGIHALGQMSDTEKAKLEKLGRTIANMKQGYYLIDETRAKVVINQLQGQEDILGLIQFINRMKFYNTMSQFLTAGIGESGSRAATIEHKAPYELSLNYFNKQLEDNYQDIADYMIDISYFAPMAKEDYPIVTFNTITQADMLREAQVIKTFVEAGLVLTEVDMNMIREHINLPVSEVKADKMTLPDENKIEQEDIKPTEMSYKNIKRNVKPEILEFEARIFEFDSANEHYLTVQEKVENEMNLMLDKIFGDIIRQLKQNRKADINLRYEGELIKKLVRLYEDAYNRGESDVRKELSKLDNKMIEMELENKAKKEIKSDLSKFVKKFFVDIKTQVETNMNKVTDKFIEKKGGIEEYLLEMQLGFKRDKREIITEVETGYSKGRGETLLDYKDRIATYLYTSVLDQNLCSECAPYDGLIFTEDEIQELGFTLGERPNPYCLGFLGSGGCRCQFVAYSLGG